MVCVISSIHKDVPSWRAITMEHEHFLDVDDLSVEFQTRNGIVKALEKVSIHVDKGEVLGIVGES